MLEFASIDKDVNDVEVTLEESVELTMVTPMLLGRKRNPPKASSVPASGILKLRSRNTKSEDTSQVDRAPDFESVNVVVTFVQVGTVMFTDVAAEKVIDVFVVESPAREPNVTVVIGLAQVQDNPLNVNQAVEETVSCVVVEQLKMLPEEIEIASRA